MGRKEGAEQGEDRKQTNGREKRREKNRMNVEKKALKIHLKINISSLSNEIEGSMSAFKLPKQTAGHTAKACACWRALPAP